MRKIRSYCGEYEDKSESLENILNDFYVRNEKDLQKAIITIKF